MLHLFYRFHHNITTVQLSHKYMWNYYFCYNCYHTNFNIQLYQCPITLKWLVVNKFRQYFCGKINNIKCSITPQLWLGLTRGGGASWWFPGPPPPPGGIMRWGRCEGDELGGPGAGGRGPGVGILGWPGKGPSPSSAIKDRYCKERNKRYRLQSKV